MDQSKIYSGTNTLTDNWLLQSVADLLSGKVDKSKDWGWVWSDSKGVYWGQIKAGALQIDCLTTLLEQVLFANNIYVMKDWIPIWYDQNTDLNALYSKEQESIIKGLSDHGKMIENNKERWLNDILHTEKLKEKYNQGMEKFKNKKEDFWSQVINGAAEYVSLSSSLNLTYAPHSVRSGFLKSTLWFTHSDQYPTPGIKKFNSLIDKERISLSETIGHDNVLVNLNVKIPSGALLCIQQSSSSFSPITIALQMRNEPEIKALRMMLHELSIDIAKKEMGENSNALELINYLEEDVKRAAHLLRIPKSIGGSEVCGNQMMRQFNYKKYIDKGIIHKENTIEHSGILMNLLNTGSLETRKILESKLNISDHTVIKHLVEWNDPSFFSKANDPKEIIDYKVHVELVSGNTIILGANSTIVNSTIDQKLTTMINNDKKNNP